MAILHQILTAEAGAWMDCADFCRPGDQVLLAGGGTHLLADQGFTGRFASAAKAGNLCALQADAAARGLEPLAKRVGATLLSDARWLELVCVLDGTVSWK